MIDQIFFESDVPRHMWAMNRSDIACCLCSSPSIVCLPMATIALGVIAVALLR